MSRAVFVGLVILAGACTHGPRFLRHGSSPEAAADSLYLSALANFDPANKNASLDAGIVNLDAYLASKAARKHVTEAVTLRRLALDAQRLVRVEAALQQAKASATETRAQPEPRAKDDEAVKEIQRLKDELAKATDELERIKKRLAAPKPPA